MVGTVAPINMNAINSVECRRITASDELSISENNECTAFRGLTWLEKSALGAVCFALTRRAEMSVHATANGEFHFRLPITCFLNCCTEVHESELQSEVANRSNDTRFEV
jgi:hypothetical protein